MKNNELIKKIGKASCWILGFFFVFLAIGFLLKSDYPIYNYPFNRVAAYEVLRDGLTLSAYFLAPVAALLIFDGWQDQHRRIANEKNSGEIIELLKKFLPFLNTTSYSLLDSDAFIDYRTKYFGYVIELKSKNKLMNPNSSDAREFIERVEQVDDLLFDFWSKIETQTIIHQELERIKFLGDEWQQMRNHYSKSINEAVRENSKTLSDFLEIQSKIKILYV